MLRWFADRGVTDPTAKGCFSFTAQSADDGRRTLSHPARIKRTPCGPVIVIWNDGYRFPAYFDEFTDKELEDLFTFKGP